MNCIANGLTKKPKTAGSTYTSSSQGDRQSQEEEAVYPSSQYDDVVAGRNITIYGNTVSGSAVFGRQTGYT